MTPRALLTLLLTSSALASAAPDPTPARAELRGLWVDAFGPGFKTPQQVTQLVSDAQKMHLNALFVQIGRRFDCYCNRSSLPRAEDPDLAPNFDPLADLLEKAHKSGIQVHAWIITTAMWNQGTAPKNPKHAFNLHGPNARGPNNWVDLKFDGSSKGGADWYADPGNPAAAAYITSMYTSIVKNYAVDGIQFDRVRYPDYNEIGKASWGYNPAALERFRQETGFKGTPGIGEASWLEWRRQQVTNLVRRTALEVKAIRPDLWVSAATITYLEGPADFAEWQRSRTYNEVLQDWATWTMEGYLDLNVMMNYKNDAIPEQAAWFDGWNNFGALMRGNGFVASGTAIYLNTLEATRQQLERARAAELDGWVGYSYRIPDAEVKAGKKKMNQGLLELTATLTSPGAPFEQPSSWGKPEVSALSALAGRVTGKPLLGGHKVEVYSQGSSVGCVQTDGNGYYGFFQLPMGPLELRVEGAAPLEVTVKSGRVNIVPGMVLTDSPTLNTNATDSSEDDCGR